jgi:hypothetical protein
MSKQRELMTIEDAWEEFKARILLGVEDETEMENAQLLFYHASMKMIENMAIMLDEVPDRQCCRALVRALEQEFGQFVGNLVAETLRDAMPPGGGFFVLSIGRKE